MPPRSYSYLDVSALDGVREKIAEGAAALVLPVTLDEVIWANGPGAELFGHSGIATFVGGDPELAPAARRQIAATPGFPDIGNARAVAVRLAKGVSSQTVMFSAASVTLPDGEQAILLSVADPIGDTRTAEQSAARAISGLASNGGGVALIDATGKINAASSSFGDLGIALATLEGLAMEVAGEADRMVKRLVPTSKGELPAGIVRLTDVPAVSLLMIANDSADEASEDEQEEAPPDSEDTNEAAEEAGQAPTLAASASEETDGEPATEQTDETDDGEASETTDDEGASSADAGPQSDSDDKWYFNHAAGKDGAGKTDAGAQAEAGVVQPDASTSDTPVQAANNAAASNAIDAEEVDGKVAAEAAPDPAAAPMRFVWRTDAGGRFSALSDEFRQAFGAEASDIVGRDFADVAENFGLDPDGEIAGLMKRRDTWSGRSVLWPITGTDLVAPVDLAALPVYGRDGTFEGFRGFGIARMGDAVVDEHARGLQLVGELAETDEAAPEQHIIAPADFAAEDSDPFKGETPALTMDATPERRESDKVIRLAERRNQQQPKGLSSAEQETFQEIGKRLKDASAEDEPTEAPYETAPAETTAADTPSEPAGAGEAAPSYLVSTDLEGAAETAEDAEGPTTASADAEAAPADAGERPHEDAGNSDDEAATPENATGMAEVEDAGVGENDVEAAEIEGAASETDVATSTSGDDDGAEVNAVDAVSEDGATAAEAEDAATSAVEEEVAATDAVETGSIEDVAEVVDDAIASKAEAEVETVEPSAEMSGDAASDTEYLSEPTADPDGTAVEANDEAAENKEASEEATQQIAAAAGADVSATDADAEPSEEEPASTDAELSPAATEPAPVKAENEKTERPKVGLSAFLPSAFSGGGTLDASIGIDSTVLSRLPLPILIHSGDELHYANREFLSLTGYRSLAEFDLAGGMDAIFAGSYEADGNNGQTLKLRARDGDEFPVHAFLQSVGWQGGKALLLALRRAEAPETSGTRPETELDEGDLETRVDELRTIIDTATDGVVIIGNDGAIRSVSKPAEALFGYNGTDLSGRPFTSLFAIESQRPAREYLDGLAGNGVASVLNDGREVIGREAQGRFIPLFMTIGRLPQQSGFCAVLRDITHWKRAEEELTEARAAAERASSQKTEFLARVSHEIRTPLNAIIGFSELMIDEKFGPIGSDRYRDYLSDINRSGNHVLDLVNDLLDISKIEAGQQELTYEAVSLNDALSEAVAMMQPQANRERVIIRSSFASNLPDVVADLRSIRQIALNLLSNAIRYTPAGGQVVVSTVYEAGDITMRVRDTGVGMAAAEIEQALKPFKQVNALKRPRGDGTGLGLPLTKAMVEANRARFAIQSTPGEGTLVEITFPSTRVLAD
ncbi:MAG: PAS domain S-box protein [Rhizobiaceae bacterium]|nr:PAS domain S-box protein [Rhizobiaceae bacterium]